MEEKCENRASSPCQRILKAIRISPAFRVIRQRPVLPGGHDSASLPPHQPPRMTRKLTINMVENGKEKGVPVDQNRSDDEVVITKSARIAPASELLPLPDRNSELEQTKPKGQLGREVPGPPQMIGLKPAEATSNNRKEKHNLVQVGEGTNEKGSVGDQIENRFSEYIERAKLKLRTVSNVGGGGTKEKRHPAEKTDEYFTNYINKAKAKLRTTSSIGGGKAVPSK